MAHIGRTVPDSDAWHSSGGAGYILAQPVMILFRKTQPVFQQDFSARGEPQGCEVTLLSLQE
jgi:hypothetical protein